MNIEKVFDCYKYKSIIFLTYFHESIDGLRQQHYRWALMPNHNGIKSTILVNEIKKLFHDYYDKQDSKGYKSGLIVKNCFRSKTNLSNHITRLADEKGYNILRKYTEDKLTKYRLSENGRLQFVHYMLIDYIKRMPIDVAQKELSNFMIADFEAIKEIIEEIKPKK